MGKEDFKMPAHLNADQRKRWMERDPRVAEAERERQEQEVTAEVREGWFNGKDGINYRAPQGIITFEKAREIVAKLTAAMGSVEKKG